MFNVEREGSEYRKLSYKDKYCVGCGICVDVCPTDSLRLGPIVPIARGLIEMDLISCNNSSLILCLGPATLYTAITNELNSCPPGTAWNVTR